MNLFGRILQSLFPRSMAWLIEATSESSHYGNCRYCPSRVHFGTRERTPVEEGLFIDVSTIPAHWQDEKGNLRCPYCPTFRAFWMNLLVGATIGMVISMLFWPSWSIGFFVKLTLWSCLLLKTWGTTENTWTLGPRDIRIKRQ